MKILVVSEVFPPKTGGSGRWLWQLFRRLRGFDVWVAAGETEGADAFDRAAELPITRVPLRFTNWGVWDPRGGISYIRAWVRLRTIIRRIRPDALHCGKCLPEGALGLAFNRLSGIPFLCYAHGEELTLAKTSRELTRLTACVLTRAFAVVANTDHTRQLLLNDWGVDDGKIIVMHPGVDTSFFKPAAPDSDVRARLGWTGRRVVLTVGALQKRKGQDMMIRALPAIRKRCPNVLYAIAGEGWERPYLERLVADVGVADYVQFRGLPDDCGLLECYQQCDLFALPNRQVGWDIEGFGIVLLEAQACGRAVVAGASGGTREAMQPGITGELIACETPDRLAAVVSELLEDQARARVMGQRGREWIVSNLDWAVLTERAARVFMQITPGRRAHDRR